MPKRTVLEAATELARETLWDCESALANPDGDSRNEVFEHYAGTLHGAWMLAMTLDSEDEPSRAVLRQAERELEKLCGIRGHLVACSANAQKIIDG